MRASDETRETSSGDLCLNGVNRAGYLLVHSDREINSEHMVGIDLLKLACPEHERRFPLLIWVCLKVLLDSIHMIQITLFIWINVRHDAGYGLAHVPFQIPVE